MLFYLQLKMKNINQEKINHQNERIRCLLAELHSTLDLYYEPFTENDIAFTDK